jgi:hypothetical protein
MRLSDYKGEEAIEVLADIIEPLTAILGDEDMKKLVADNKGKKVAPVAYIKPILKNHPKEVIAVLAGIEKEPVEEYEKKVNVLTLPMKLLELMNDPQMQSLFTSQGQTDMNSQPHSGSATENTEAEEN